MGDKRSKGVTIFAWVWLATAILSIILTMMVALTLSMPQENKIGLLKSPAMQQLKIDSVAKYDEYYQSIIITTLPLGIILLIISIGLFKLKKWSLIGIIIISILQIGTALWKFLNNPATTFYNMGAFLSLLQYGVSLYFFTRPKVKEQFK